MTCRHTNLGPATTVFTCGRPGRPTEDLPACSNCGAPGARLACQFALTGSKTDQRCGRPLCRKCVRRAVTDQDLCPPHHKLSMTPTGSVDDSSP